MLDPRYKNAIFSSGDRASAFNLVIEELENLQGIKLVNKKDSPPAKRTKAAESFDFMEEMLDGLDEQRKSLEEYGLKNFEDVS